MEIWDVYDIDRIKKDKTMIRGADFEKGDYHLVVHVCIFNSKGEMLIQQRQPFKTGWSNMWDITVGGSATQGDTSQAAAERETFEEIGLKIDLSGIRPHLSIYFGVGFDDVYLIEKDVKLEDLKFQYSEVKAAKWASHDEILKMIDDGTFVPYYKSFIAFIFDNRRRYGCIEKPDVSTQTKM